MMNADTPQFDWRRSSRLPDRVSSRLRLPLIAAPMFTVSGPELMVAVCSSGVVGSFPTINARSVEELDTWMAGITARLADTDTPAAPLCPNLIMRHERLQDDLAILLRHETEMVITSVGSPAPILPQLRDAGIQVFADVATLEHASKARDAGVDGLILLTAGAGGQTGWLNPFAYVRAVRDIFDGPIVLAGGMSDGVALRAAITLGCDLAYMGTRFIATRESMADQAYCDMLVACSLDDIHLTRAITGLPGNYLRPSLIGAGLDPAMLDETATASASARQYGRESGDACPKRWKTLWGGGHSVSGVNRVESAALLIERCEAEFHSGGER